YLAGKVTFANTIPEALEHVLYDPQTSGGLLFAVTSEDARRVEPLFAAADEPVWRIGDVVEGQGVDVTAQGYRRAPPIRLFGPLFTGCHWSTISRTGIICSSLHCRSVRATHRQQDRTA